MANHPPKKFKKTGCGKVKSLKPSHTFVLATNLSKKERVILDTLKYRQIFGCPMTVFQIWTYLLTIDHSPKMSPQEFRQALAQLVKSGTVIEKNGLYSLGKVDYGNYAQNQARAKELIVKANAVTHYLKKIPWIEMIALTGDVSAFNADKHADIDILVVTKPRRLFLSRFFLVVILKLLGVYWSAKNSAGKVCPNIFMTSDAMTWDAKNQNLYTANEVSLLYPLFSRNTCYLDFLAQNAWVSNFLPNFTINITAKPADEKNRNQRTNVLVNFVEFVARKSQLSHMRKKQTKEIVTKNFLHFNIHDKTSDIIGKFRKPQIGV